MFEKLSLRIFWVCMVACATAVLFVIWTYGEPSVFQGRIVGTTFVFGLANALIWVPLVIYRFYNAIAER